MLVGVLTGVGVVMGRLVEVLTGVGVNAGRGVPQADKNKVKEIVKLKSQNFFIFISLARLNNRVDWISKPISAMQAMGYENVRENYLSKFHGWSSFVPLH